MPERRGKTPIEREVKLAAPASFTLPSLEGLAEGVAVEPLAAKTLDAVYYDTADLRLARWGVSMRFRTGEGGSGTWTVKLPEGEEGPALVRREVPVAGPAGTPPEDALALVRAYVRSAPLVAVARLRTRRHGVALRDGEGHLLAEVVDDEVAVIEGRKAVARFREVEVEIDGRAPGGLLGDVVGRLRAAGAGAPDPMSKVVRALGERAQAPAEVVPLPLGDRPTAGEVVTSAIAGSVARVLVHDAGVRLGDDPEDVHQARVGTRRLRSDLRTFGPLLDRDWGQALRDELGWIADLLGAVRDADVLGDRLRAQAAALPEVDAAGLAPVLLRLADEREVARSALIEAMNGPRYVSLLDRLVLAARAPLLLDDVARKRARRVLPPLVRTSWRTLRTAVTALPPVPADEALHAIRIHAKRARYAAEGVGPAAGKAAAAFAAAMAEVQGVLGDHHDAIVAEQWLRTAAVGAEVEQVLALGELIGAERADAAQCRAAWPAAWKQADRKKLRAWFR